MVHTHTHTHTSSSAHETPTKNKADGINGAMDPQHTQDKNNHVVASRRHDKGVMVRAPVGEGIVNEEGKDLLARRHADPLAQAGVRARTRSAGDSCPRTRQAPEKEAEDHNRRHVLVPHRHFPPLGRRMGMFSKYESKYESKTPNDFDKIEIISEIKVCLAPWFGMEFQ